MSRGYPDYTSRVAPARSALISGQARFELYGESSIASGATLTLASLYTVPAGYTLYLGHVFIGCTHDIVSWYAILRDSVGVYEEYYDLGAKTMYGDLGSLAFEAGEVLGVQVYNADTATRAYKYYFAGTLSKV